MSLGVVCALLVALSSGGEVESPQAAASQAEVVSVPVPASVTPEAVGLEAQGSTDWVARAPGLVHPLMIKIGEREVVGYQLSTTPGLTARPTVVLTSFSEAALRAPLSALIERLREDPVARQSLESFRWIVLPNLGQWGAGAASFGFDFPVGWRPASLASASATKRPSTVPLADAGTRAFAAWLQEHPEVTAVVALDGPDRGGLQPEVLGDALSDLLRSSETLRAVSTTRDGGWLDYARTARGVFTLSMVDGADAQVWSREVTAFVDGLPRVQLELSSVETLATGLWRVDLRLTNTGRLPLSQRSVNRQAGGATLLALSHAKLLVLAQSDAANSAFRVIRKRSGAQLLEELPGGMTRMLRAVVEADGEVGQLVVNLSGPRVRSLRLDVPLGSAF